MNSKKAVALRWIWPLIVSAAATNCLDDQSPLPTRVLLQSQSELTKAENSTGTPFMVLDVWDETHPTHSTFVEHFFGAIGLLLTVSLAIYLKFIVEDYEEKTSANSPPWFCDERIIVQVGGGFVLAWVVIGVMVFTQVLSFSVLGKERNLTALEALYVCAEILTTVGYGDVSPSSYASQAFCAVYSILGCSLIAVVFSLLFNPYLGTQRHLVPLTHPAVAAAAAHSRPRYKGAMQTLRPVILALAIGTVFFTYYPGEEKSPWEAFYMSVQTLTTVGFGDVYPATQGGRAFATVWMLLGVTAAANLIVTVTDAILKYRKDLKAEHMTKELLLHMSTDGSGKVGKTDFLCYELIRRGLCETDELAEIVGFFNKLDSKKLGYLDFKDFSALVTLQAAHVASR
mmetsp:Transcript_8115/g.18162  ORF Transcript_8115/g.18162 Transcript_8115/m.18162 type:complete len:399 (-) Transcript_8115:26-1222(-)